MQDMGKDKPAEKMGEVVGSCTHMGMEIRDSLCSDAHNADNARVRFRHLVLDKLYNLQQQIYSVMD